MQQMQWTVLEYEDDHNAVLVRLTDGVHEIAFAATVELTTHRAVLSGCDIQGAGRNTVGVALLRRLAAWMKERLDVDELRIEGSVRASGANPGRLPRPLTF
jgi:hypothetical protein